MIKSGVFNKNNKAYNRKLDITYDFRFSITALGLIRYFKFAKFDFFTEDEYLYYNYESIDINDKFYEFFYDFYKTQKKIENLKKLISLCKEEKYNTKDFNDEDKDIFKSCYNEVFSSHTFKKLLDFEITFKEDEETLKKNLNKLNLYLEKNYLEIVRMYVQYSIYDNYVSGESISKITQEDKAFLKSGINTEEREKKDCNKVCRIRGFYYDTQRKSNTFSYGFDKDCFSYMDYKEFSFFPFGLMANDYSIFINANTDVTCLVNVNEELHNTMKRLPEMKKYSLNFYAGLLVTLLDTEGFIYSNFEMIHIDRIGDKTVVKSVYANRFDIDILRKVNEKFSLVKSLGRALNKNYTLIKNNNTSYVPLSYLIFRMIFEKEDIRKYVYHFLKEDLSNKTVESDLLVSMYIFIRSLIMESNVSTNEIQSKVYGCAKSTVGIYRANDRLNILNGLCQKLFSAYSANNSETVYKLLIHMCMECKMSYSFLDDLYEDYDKNRLSVLLFINGLNKYMYGKVKEDTEKENSEKNTEEK